MLSKLAVEVRVDGEDETDTEHVHEGDNEETRHRVLVALACSLRALGVLVLLL